MLPPRRRLLPMLVVALLATGCADVPDDVPAPPSEAPVRGGTVHYAQIAPTSLDPAIVYYSYDAALVNLVHAGLLRHDRNFGIRPDVARSWRIVDGGRRYRFALREDVRFHDGRPVRAEDVVHSFQRVFDLDPASTQLARQYLSMIEGARAYARGEAERITGLHVVDPFTIEIQLERPYAAFLNVMASEFARILPRAADDRDTTVEVGCGPFRLVEWSDADRLVLARHDAYHGNPIHLDGVVVHTPPDPVIENALKAFEAGRLHLVELTNVDDEDMPDTGPVDLLHRLELSLTFLAFAVDRPPFDDVTLRRAIAHAVDMTALPSIDPRRRPMANGVLPPGFPGYEPVAKTLASDPERAAQLLEDADLPERPIRVGIPARGPAFEEFAKALCAQIEAIGIAVEPQRLDWSEFGKALHARSFDAFLLTWVADIPDPDSFFSPLFHSAGSVNHLHYADPDVDAWLETARGEGDGQRRMELYRRTERRVLDDAVIVPLHFNSTVFAVRRELRGFEITSMGSAQIRLDSVWLDDATGGPAR